jgi:Protein of unknown function (DUF2510)
MTAQIVGPNAFTIELVTALVVVSMAAGVIDLFRHPAWAWRSAEESRIAYLVLILLLPLIGLGMYVFGARPKVVSVASAGRAASLPFERFGEESVQKQREDGRPLGTIAAPVALGSFGEIRGEGPYPFGEPASLPVGGAGSFLHTGGTATLRSPAGLARAYRPRQRDSVPGVERVADTATGSTTMTVPSGWKADPTGRHEFRYWDGEHWTENVADAGLQDRDAVTV